jgi:predicted deacetylase
LLLVFLFAVLRLIIYDLDVSTSVKVNEKIVIIELDDYWNFEDTEPYFEKYGYTLERYRAVSNLIDKYDFVATLGVTPYIFVEDIKENFPLRDDEEMVTYLKELDEKGYELGMHGYNHCRNEYYCPQYEEVWYNVLAGKQELESIFQKPFFSYFPPGNEWTTEQYENVRRAGFLMIGNTHVPKAYFDENVIITQKGYDPIYVYKWYAIDFRYTSVDEWIEDYNEKNLFIIQLHANTFDTQAKLDDLDEFLAYVKEDGAKVMTYKEFYFYIKEKQEAIGKDLSGYAILEIQ